MWLTRPLEKIESANFAVFTVARPFVRSLACVRAFVRAWMYCSTGRAGKQYPIFFASLLSCTGFWDHRLDFESIVSAREEDVGLSRESKLG